MIALLLTCGLLATGQTVVTPPVDPPATTAAVGGYRSAEAEWNARRKWAREVDTLLQDEAADVVEGSTPSQAAQDAPTEPRTARPAPTPLIASEALTGLVASLQPHARAQRRIDALLHALALRDRQRAVHEAVALAQIRAEIDRDDEAVLLLLMES